MTRSTTDSRPAVMNRRSFLRTSAIATAATATVGASSVSAQSTDFGGWFDDVSNYDGVVDATGQSEVRITVGASTDQGPYGYGPAAVRVDPGTTVVWEWNGEGGVHNVAAEDGSFESELVDEEGHTFERTFDEEGVTKYYCTPHEAMGMKGAIVVGSAGSTGGGDAAAASASGGVEYLVTGVLAGAILTVLALLPFSDARRRRQRTR